MGYVVRRLNDEKDGQHRVILYSMKDHLIPHIARKTTGKDMFYDLVTIY